VAVLPAHRVATPVLERLAGDPRGAAGVVLGAGATAAWVDLDGFVVAVTTREVPLLPNAVALAAGSGALQRPGVVPGATGRLAPGRIDLGAVRVTWDPAAAPAWDPTVPVPVDAGPEAVARRGAALLEALGAGSRRVAPRTAADPGGLVRDLARIGLPTANDPDGADGLALVFRAVWERDPVPAAGAARGLLGRGPGLTPEGDDLVAAVAGTLAVLGPAARLDGPALNGLLTALAPPPGRTTALAATLLELAAGRRLAEPAGRLLDLGPGGEAAWPAALARLERLGHGSGRAYAAGIAATALLLAAGSPVG
jgi:Protein of unknown function (DUF2877)